MAKPITKHPRKSALPFVLAGTGMLGLVIWFAVSSDPREEIAAGADSPPSNGSDVSEWKPDHGNGGGTDRAGKTNAGKRAVESGGSEEGEDGPQFPLVDQILSDDGLSNEESASRLLEIAANKSLSVLEREEALSHGLNLDFPQFIGLVADPALPQPLAQRFFDEMLNYNDYRDLQVRACVSLVDHEDEGMREEAAQQLAFYIGLEEWADKPEELKQEARAYLEDLAKRPKPEPEPVDPDADIPETKPINPLEREEEDDGETGEASSEEE
jgi:hypothetical protein